MQRFIVASCSRHRVLVSSLCQHRRQGEGESERQHWCVAAVIREKEWEGGHASQCVCTRRLMIRVHTCAHRHAREGGGGGSPTAGHQGEGKRGGRTHGVSVLLLALCWRHRQGKAEAERGRGPRDGVGVSLSSLS